MRWVGLLIVIGVSIAVPVIGGVVLLLIGFSLLAG